MRLRSIGIAAATAALIAVGVIAAPAQAGTSPKWGCPGGAVCMYDTQDHWLNDTPDHVWYSYGYHALTDEYGPHWVFNNQYATSAGRAGAYACKAAKASSCTLRIAMDDWESFDATPINYIRLTPSGG